MLDSNRLALWSNDPFTNKEGVRDRLLFFMNKHSLTPYAMAKLTGVHKSQLSRTLNLSTTLSQDSIERLMLYFKLYKSNFYNLECKSEINIIVRLLEYQYFLNLSDFDMRSLLTKRRINIEVWDDYLNHRRLISTNILSTFLFNMRVTHYEFFNDSSWDLIISNERKSNILNNF